MSKKAPKVERPRFAARVIDGRVVGDDPWSQEVIDKLPAGRRLMFEVDEEESADGVRAHIMAGINLLYANADDCGPGKKNPTPRHLRRAILRAIGFAEPIHRVDGIKLEARSMEREQFPYEELVTCLELMRTYCFEHYGFDPFQAYSDERDAEAANRARRR